MSATLNKETTITDPSIRLRKLIEAAEPRLAALFLVLMKNIKDSFTLDQLADLLEQGRIDEAIERAVRAGTRYASEVQGIIIATGIDTAEFLTKVLDELVVFNSTSQFTLDQFARDGLRFIRDFTVEMQAAARQAIVDGLVRGLNPREQARNFRNSIGLSARQVDAVNRYRSLLEQNSLEALQRELRDRRFDPTVRRAAATGDPLSTRQIDRMVDRYSERQLRWRSEMIARTEALRAVHAGSQEMYRQAILSGDLDADTLLQQWIIAGDNRVRSSHAAMSGQRRPIGEPFLSGNGNSLRFPGDPNAPASDTINCRCTLSTRITNTTL